MYSIIKQLFSANAWCICALTWFGCLSDEFWFSDGSLAEKSKFTDPGLMPLPDTASDLDWSHLVDAARAFEGMKRYMLFTRYDLPHGKQFTASSKFIYTYWFV